MEQGRFIQYPNNIKLKGFNIKNDSEIIGIDSENTIWNYKDNKIKYLNSVTAANN